MTDFVRWLFLALAAGSLVPVASNVIRRSLTCEEELQDVGIEPTICEKIRSAVSSVRQAVLDIDGKVTEISSKNFMSIHRAAKDSNRKNSVLTK